MWWVKKFVKFRIRSLKVSQYFSFWNTKICSTSMQFLKSFDFGLAAYLDFCLAHQIQQPIPKLRILSFHNYKQRRLVMIGQTRDQTNRKNSDSYFWNWLLDLVANILKNIWKKKSYLFETPKFARHPCHSLKCRLWTRSPSGLMAIAGPRSWTDIRQLWSDPPTDIQRFFLSGNVWPVGIIARVDGRNVQTLVKNCETFTPPFPLPIPFRHAWIMSKTQKRIC